MLCMLFADRRKNTENTEEVLLDMENYDRLGDKIGSCVIALFIWRGDVARGPYSYGSETARSRTVIYSLYRVCVL